MTDLMQKAIAELSKLSEDQQDNIAQWILAELADEERWDALFARSQPQLEILAKRAIANRRAGFGSAPTRIMKSQSQVFDS